MKKNSLLFTLVCITSLSFGQINLRTRENTSEEKNQFIIRLSDQERQSFNPEKAERSLGLADNVSFNLLSKENDGLGTYYRYQQKINNVPVENSMLIAHTRNGELSVISGNIISSTETFNNKVRAAISSNEAIQKALALVHAKHYAWDASEESNDEIRNANAPTAELVWYCPEEFLNPSNMTLAFKVIIYATEPLSRAAYYFDASNGS